MIKTAIMVDGGFYRKKNFDPSSPDTPEDAADKLVAYCRSQHIDPSPKSKYQSILYRIFYYDCPPLDKRVFHPLNGKNIDFKTTPTYNWTLNFFKALCQKRKLALRLGKLEENKAFYNIKQQPLRKLCRGEKQISDLEDNDFVVAFTQKGVDMRIGLDIASLSYKRQVDQIVLISGDSDFVPAAKLARREGIDFILDPLGQKINNDLFEHIDGLGCARTRKKS